MSTPDRLHRFAPDGRYLGFIVVDRPIEQYAQRTDLTDAEPMSAVAGQWPYRVDGVWVLRDDPALVAAQALPALPVQDTGGGGA